MKCKATVDEYKPILYEFIGSAVSKSKVLQAGKIKLSNVTVYVQSKLHFNQGLSEGLYYAGVAWNSEKTLDIGVLLTSMWCTVQYTNSCVAHYRH